MNRQIQELRATLSSYGMTKLSTASDVTDANAAALSAVEKNGNVSGTLANNIIELYGRIPGGVIVKSTFRLQSKSGWYRILKIRTSNNVASRGSGGLVITFYIIRAYISGGAESHLCTYFRDYNSSKVVNHGNTTHDKHITKLRSTYDTLGTVYFDIYYSHDGSIYENPVNITIINPTDGWGFIGESVNGTLVDTTPTNETILGEFDI